MENFLEKFSKFIQTSLMVVLVVLAVYSAVGRQFVSQAGNYKEDLEAFLSERFEGCVRLKSLDGLWNNFLPEVAFTGFKLYDRDFKGQCQDYLPASLSLTSGSFTLDVVNSLLQKKLVLREVLVNGLQVKIWQDIDENWYLNSLNLSNRQLPVQDVNYHKQQALPEPIVNFILTNNKISFFNSRLELSTHDGDTLSLDNIEFVLLNDLTRHTIAGKVINNKNSAQTLTFTMELDGDPRDVDDFEAEIYLKHENLDLTKWAPIFINSPDFEITTLHSSGQLWADFVGGQVNTITGVQNIPKLGWSVKGQAIPTVSYFSFGYEYARKSTYQSINVHDLTFAWRDDLWTNSHLALDVSNNGLTFKTDILRLSLINQLALAHIPQDTKAYQVFEELDPRGFLRDVEFILPLRSSEDEEGEYVAIPDLENMSLRAMADSVSVDNYEFSPVVRNANGFIKMSGLRGYADVKSDAFTLGFPKLFRKNWQFDEGRGRLFFDVSEGFRLRSNVLKTKSYYGDVTGKLDINIPGGGQPAYMGLLIGTQHTKGDITTHFLPRFLPDGLHHYLGEQSGLTADVSEGVFFYNGRIDPKAKMEDINLQVKVDFTEGYFDYLPGWPGVRKGRGLFLMNNDLIDIDIDRGLIGELGLTDNRLQIYNLFKKPTLEIKARSKGSVATYLDFVHTTPLNEMTKGIFDDWQADGNLKGNLKINVNLYDGYKVNETKLFLTLSGSFVNFPDQNIVVSDVSGDFSFDLQKGVFAENVTATALKSSIKLNLIHENFLKSEEVLNIQVFGHVSQLELSKFLRQDLSPYVSGDTDYYLDINFRRSLEESTATVTSDLAGMEVKMPAPFRLLKDEKKRFTLQTTLDKDLGEFQFKYGDIIRGQGKNTAKQFAGAQIILGKDVNPIKHTDGKIHVHGNIDYLDIDEWGRYFRSVSDVNFDQGQSYVNYARLNQMAQYIGESSIFVETLMLDDDEITNVSLQAGSEGDNWGINIDTSLLKALIFYEPSNPLPFSFNVQYVDIDGIMDVYELDEGEIEKSEVRVIPQKLPMARFNFSSLVYRQVDLGELSFELMPQKTGAHIRNIKANLAELSLEGDMHWRQKKGKHQTQLTADISTESLGKIFILLGKQPFLQSKDATFYLNWGWSDTPYNFALKDVHGYSEFDIKNGLARVSSKAADVSKILGLINIDSMLKSFKGDFKDFYGDGVYIEAFNGQVDFQGGHAKIVDRILFEGPTIKALTRGNFDLNGEAMNLDVTVTLPMAGNVPAIAIIFFYFGAPFVAGYYITEKLIGNQLERFTSARYDVSGPWENPAVTVVPLFASDKEKEQVLKEIGGEEATPKEGEVPSADLKPSTAE